MKHLSVHQQMIGYTHTHTLKCYSAIKKEHNATNCSNTGGGGEHCTKGSILDGKDKKWYHSYV